MSAKPHHAGWIALALLAACAMAPGRVELATGVRVYESGRFSDAATYLQRSLDMGIDAAEQVTAHKYLAFIHCVAGREVQCKDEFRRALALQPSFDLTLAEAGHPTWGPVFRDVKSGPK